MSDEATPAEAVAVARRLVQAASKADSLEHMRANLEAALIWLRAIDPADVRNLWDAAEKAEEGRR